MEHLPLAQLVDAAGSQTALANAIGASQQIISYWLAKNKPLPAEFVLAAEKTFGVSRHDLRPDLYPRDDDHSPGPSVGNEEWPISSAASAGKPGDISGRAAGVGE